MDLRKTIIDWARTRFDKRRQLVYGLFLLLGGVSAIAEYLFLPAYTGLLITIGFVILLVVLDFRTSLVPDW